MLTEPIEAFLSDAFASDVAIDGVSVRAIFDADYAVPGGMSGSRTQLTMATADVPTEPIGLPAVIGNERYQIVEHQPDGTGFSALLLERMP